MTSNRTSHHVRRVREIGEAVSAAETVAGVADAVLHGVAHALDGITGRVVLLEADGVNAVVAGATGPGRAGQGAGQRLTVEDAGAPGLVVPLSAGGRPVGAIVLDVAGTEALGADARDFLGATAQLCALGLERVRLARGVREATASRDAFLALAAHELRTPITSLRGFAQLLLRQFRRGGPPDPARLAAALVRIDEQSAKLTRLISQLLDLWQVSHGDLRLDRRPLDVGQLVRRTVTTFAATADRHQITVDAPDGLRAALDAERLEHVILNLLANAVAASLDGPIEVQLAQADDTTLRLTIADHGTPPPVERRGRLFQRDAYLGGEGAPGGWPGLWLDASRRFVELHGGSIGAEFPAAGGTRLTVSLPRQ